MTGIPVPPPITVILGFLMNDSLSPYVDPYHDVFHWLSNHFLNLGPDDVQKLHYGADHLYTQQQ